MRRVLVTGMTGTGKSTVLAELRRRGYETVDTDYDEWTLPDGRWAERRMDELLSGNASVIVSGTVENQGLFYDRFDAVVLLSAPIDIILERARLRTDNPYGKSKEEQADIRRYVITVEPLLRKSATIELDGQRPTSELADVIDELVAR